MAYQVNFKRKATNLNHSTEFSTFPTFDILSEWVTKDICYPTNSLSIQKVPDTDIVVAISKTFSSIIGVFTITEIPDPKYVATFINNSGIELFSKTFDPIPTLFQLARWVETEFNTPTKSYSVDKVFGWDSFVVISTAYSCVHGTIKVANTNV